MRSKEVTRAASLPELPAPNESGKVMCDDVALWCLNELLPEFGDLNARMKRVRQGE